MGHCRIQGSSLRVPEAQKGRGKNLETWMEWTQGQTKGKGREWPLASSTSCKYPVVHLQAKVKPQMGSVFSLHFPHICTPPLKVASLQGRVFSLGCVIFPSSSRSLCMVIQPSELAWALSNFLRTSISLK